MNIIMLILTRPLPPYPRRLIDWIVLAIFQPFPDEREFCMYYLIDTGCLKQSYSNIRIIISGKNKKNKKCLIETPNCKICRIQILNFNCTFIFVADSYY